MAWSGIFRNPTRPVKTDGVFMPCDDCKAPLVVRDVDGVEVGRDTSADDGTFFVQVPGAGSYTAEVDTATLVG